MNNHKWIILVIFVGLVMAFPQLTAKAVDRGCNITQFSLSPDSSSYSLGDVIALVGKSNCGTVKFEINGQSRSEIGSTDQTMNFNTAEWGIGNHSICFVARGEGGWENADRKCRNITVKAPDRGCQISSFNLSPNRSSFNLGEEIILDGRSNCGTVRFDIDGQTKNELGSTNLSMTIKTNEWGTGNHNICFLARGNGGWEMADKQCKQISIVSADRGCNITGFSLEPNKSNFSIGETVLLSGRSNCGTVRFDIDGQTKNELGSTNLSMTIKTNDWGAGNHKLCFLARGNGGWEAADQICKKVYFGDNPPEQDDEIQEEVSDSTCQNHAKFITDITIPDDSTLDPGKKYVKTWRVRNDGKCEWSSSFSLVRMSGPSMGGDISISRAVKPGEQIDISIEIQTPNEPGKYKTTWQFKDDRGNYFTSRLFAQIIVAGKSSDSQSQTSSGMDIDLYCKNRGYVETFPNNKNNANSWICSKPGDQSFVNFDDVCKQQHGNGFKAVVADASDPYSWGCEISNQNSLVPQTYAADLNYLDIAGTSTNCGKQCVALIRETFPASKNWGVFAKGTPQEWYAELESHQGEYYFDDTNRKYVYIRGKNETPEAGDIIVWSSSCLGGISSAGHTGILASFIPNDAKQLRVNDYNFGEPSKCWTNNPRTYTPSCMLFIEPQLTNTDPAPHIIETPEIPEKETTSPLWQFFCHTLNLFCSNSW